MNKWTWTFDISTCIQLISYHIYIGYKHQWQTLTDILKRILLPPMSDESLSTTLRRDRASVAIISVLSVFTTSLLLTKRHQFIAWIPDLIEQIHRMIHFLTAPYHQHTCQSHMNDQKLHPTQSWSKVWTRLVPEQNPGVLLTQRVEIMPSRITDYGHGHWTT